MRNRGQQPSRDACGIFWMQAGDHARGTRLPIGKNFTALKKLTQLGIRIEIAQLDVGFSVPAPDNRVPNYSWDRDNPNVHSQVKRMFKNVNKEVYSTHHIHPNANGQDINSAKRRGTLSLKKKRKKWEKTPKAAT